jgi:hypothetical protein
MTKLSDLHKKWMKVRGFRKQYEEPGSAKTC